MGLVLVVTPSSALAHVKWFEDSSRFPLRTDLIFGPSTALWLGASAVVLLWASLAQRLLGRADWPQCRIWHHLAAGGPTQLAVLAAIGLVSAAVRPALFAPNLSLPAGPIGLAVAGIELAIAATFVTGIGHWIGALLLIGLMLAAALMRVLTGLAVIAAACEEKLWNPALGRAFIDHHPLFNVLHGLLGLPFSDDTFVLLIGVAEGTMGVLLASGLLTRVVVLGMWLPFNVAIPFLPPQELLGHLPIFGAMYLMLAHGPGALWDWRRGILLLRSMRGPAIRTPSAGQHAGWPLRSTHPLGEPS